MARPRTVVDQQTEQSKLSKALEDLNKEYGRNSIIRVGDDVSLKDIEVISTGSLQLDRALEIGGYPTGRIVEMWGPESSGKTTLCLHAVAEAQKLGKKAAIIDMEHALDLAYAAKVGVDVDNMLLAQPSNGEEALNMVKRLLETEEVGIIVVDSLAALVPKSEAEGEIGDANVGKQARMISQAMRILSPLVEKSKTLVIFTNQIRMKIGVMFGSPETTAGGEAMKYFASVRMEVRRSVIATEETSANLTKVTIKKSKVSTPFKKVEFNINFGEGIDRMKEVIELAVDLNIINKAGSWYSYGEERIGQGEDSVKEKLRADSELYEQIQQRIKDSLVSG